MDSSFCWFTSSQSPNKTQYYNFIQKICSNDGQFSQFWIPRKMLPLQVFCFFFETGIILGQKVHLIERNKNPQRVIVEQFYKNARHKQKLVLTSSTPLTLVDFLLIYAAAIKGESGPPYHRRIYPKTSTPAVMKLLSVFTVSLAGHKQPFRLAVEFQQHNCSILSVPFSKRGKTMLPQCLWMRNGNF